MSLKAQQDPRQYFDNMLDTIKPKSKYLSQMHVEDFIDQIYMEIVNGDTEIATETIPYSQTQQKTDFEKMIKRKILSQAQKEKELLQQKLNHLSHSIMELNSMESTKSPRYMRQSYSVNERREKQSWRKQIEEREKNLEKKKKIVQQNKTKKEQEMKQLQQKRRQQQIQKKKKEILQNVKSIQERSKKRQQIIRQSNQKYKTLKKQKLLYDKLQESYIEKQKSLLDERKKKLADIRSLHKPLDGKQLQQHEQRFLQSKKQKQQMRHREKMMNQSRSNSLQPFYKSAFYQKISQQQKNKDENVEALRQRIKNYHQKIKQRYVPEVDEQKKQELQKYIQNQKRKVEQKAQRQRQLINKGKKKGMQYLQQVRSLPKKPRKKSQDLNQSNVSRRQYPNYLTHTQKQPSKPWTTILKSGADKQQKALLLQYQSQKYEQQLKRREEQRKIIKKGNSQEIDQQYFQMIKAKLDLLGQN